MGSGLQGRRAHFQRRPLRRSLRPSRWPQPPSRFDAVFSICIFKEVTFDPDELVWFEIFICEEHILAPPGVAGGGVPLSDLTLSGECHSVPPGPSRPPVYHVSLTLAPNGGEAQGQGHGPVR